RGPAIVVGQRLALLGDEPAELLDAELRNEELDPRAAAVLLLAEPREYARDGLGLGQQLLFGRELREHLRLVRNGTQPATHHDLEAALPVDDARDVAGVVQLDQTARLVLAARERGLELAPEVLHVGVA